jgi:hypothetical protein
MSSCRAKLCETPACCPGGSICQLLKSDVNGVLTLQEAVRIIGRQGRNRDFTHAAMMAVILKNSRRTAF